MAGRTSKRGAPPLEAPPRSQPERPTRGSSKASRAKDASPTGAEERRSGIVLHKSPARLKLEALEKEHERLLREIEKKKFGCQTTEQLIRDTQDTLAIKTEPLRTGVSARLREIHQIFAKLLSRKSRLDRIERAELGRFYREVLGGAPHEEEWGAEPEEPAAGAREAGEQGPPFDPPWPGGAHEAEHASAAKPSDKNTNLLRALYRKLTVALHPDRARDPNESARLTSVMKEVTRAYADQDLAKLIELDRNWLAQSPAGDVEGELERRAQMLLEANRELRRQQRALTIRLKELEQTLPGVFGRGRKRPSSSSEIAASILQSLERELHELERLRDTARDLLDGRIGVLEFLFGPRAAADGSASPRDVFDQMLEEFLEVAWDRGSAPRPRSRRR